MSSSSSFENQLMHGYEKHLDHFDGWCEKARSVLGEIRQCGIIELHQDGQAYIAANKPDIGEQNLNKKYYLRETNWSFFKNPINEIATHSTQFGHENSKVYLKNYRTSWFYLRDIVSDEIQRNYFFLADSPLIFEKVIQNMVVVKKFLSFFKEESQKIISYQQDHKFNLAGRSSNYYSTSDIDKTEREKINDLFHAMGILKEDVNITEREWQCIKLMEFGKSASSSGDILGISRRTVETHISNIKNKLQIHSKAQILDVFR